MSWKDYMRTASFRGIEFHVYSTSTTVGRRTTLHEYDDKDEPYLEDKGRAADKFKIEGYIVQNQSNDLNYMKERDALIAALTKKGPGILIHPFYGEQFVGLDSPATISESWNEGGIAKFSMSFVQAGTADILAAAPDYTSLMDAIVDYLDAIGLDNAADLLSGAMDAASLAQDALATLETIQSVINGVQNGISSAIASAAGFVTQAIVGINALLGTPCSIVRMIQSTSQQVKNIAGLGNEVVSGGVLGRCSGQVRSNKETFVLTGESVPEDLGLSICRSIIKQTDYDYLIKGTEKTTSEGLVAKAAMSNFTKASLFGSGCRIAMRINYKSKDALIDLMEEYSEALDSFLIEMGGQSSDVRNVDTYNAVEELRSKFVEYMLGLGKDLTQLENYSVPGDGLNTLVLAYNKYESTARADEIFDMNRLGIRHPGFIVGGEMIEVLAK